MTIPMVRDTTEDRYAAEGTVSAGATSEWIPLTKYKERKALVAIHPTGNMRAEFTLDPMAAVDADEAREFPWEEGDVTVDTATSIPNNVTAVRFVGDGAFRVVV